MKLQENNMTTDPDKCYFYFEYPRYYKLLESVPLTKCKFIPFYEMEDNHSVDNWCLISVRDFIAAGLYASYTTRFAHAIDTFDSYKVCFTPDYYTIDNDIYYYE